MKLSNTLAALLLMSNATTLAHPQPIANDLVELREFDPHSDEQIFADASELYKRKGGGGGGGKGGGSSSSGSSSSGSSSSGSSSSSSSGKGGGSSSSSSSSSANRGSSSSNAGGATKSGSGAPKTIGGGRYYGGGASTPYSAGSRSPSGILPLAIGLGVGGAAAVALSHYPGYWPYGFYSYPYVHPYGFYNRTGRSNQTVTSSSSSTTATPTSTLAARSFPVLMIRQDDGTGENETKPVTCLCDPYAVCGCDEPSNSTFLDSLIGDGTYASLNQSVVTVADINGTSTIILNGTLPNGTTASGGTDDSTSDASSSATSTPSSSIAGFLGSSGYFVMVALVGCTVFMV